MQQQGSQLSVGNILSKVGLPSTCKTCGTDCDNVNCPCPEC
jgi:hypothetical protein